MLLSMKPTISRDSPSRTTMMMLLAGFYLFAACEVQAFGLIGPLSSNIIRKMTIPMSEIAESINGETYVGGIVSQEETEAVVDEIVDDLLVSTLSSHSSNTNSSKQNEGSSTCTPSSIPDYEVTCEETVSPFAPPLTYGKFLTMQSKRVPVAIRYEGESGLKPYFLTVAKKIKDAHPDVILDKVILPKVVVGGDHQERASMPTFEVLVDGKVVIPTLGKKDRDGALTDTIFVSMQELETAITRARKRRRPSTVYGEEDSNVRLELLKAKAAATANPSSGRTSSKKTSD